MMPSRPRILVVEESYPTALAVCDMIVRHGCDVAGMVGHVDKGLEFVRDNPLDGAVIDIDLQGDASLPLCEQLRKRDIPFLLLKKPVDDRELARALAEVAAAPELRRRLTDHNRAHVPETGWDDVLQRCDLAYKVAAELSPPVRQ